MRQSQFSCCAILVFACLLSVCFSFPQNAQANALNDEYTLDYVESLYLLLPDGEHLSVGELEGNHVSMEVFSPVTVEEMMDPESFDRLYSIYSNPDYFVYNVGFFNVDDAQGKPWTNAIGRVVDHNNDVFLIANLHPYTNAVLPYLTMAQLYGDNADGGLTDIVLSDTLDPPPGNGHTPLLDGPESGGLSAEVPEPGTFLLFGAGLAALTRRRRKFKG